jgi:hypothetical protein
MFQHAGEWSYTIGLPAKSGISGCLYLVVPNLMGVAIYSPVLDEHGIPARATQFARLLVDGYRLSVFDRIVSRRVSPFAALRLKPAASGEPQQQQQKQPPSLPPPQPPLSGAAQ